MFTNYYEILDVSIDATSTEIKSAYKKQAIKWHPDKHQGVDTTYKMQAINEAYLMLKDVDARERYDAEYQKYQEFQKRSESPREEKYQDTSDDTESNDYQENTDYHQSYTVQDDILNKWMENAKKQAVDLAQQTIQDMKGMVSEGAKGAVNQIVYQIIGILIVSFLFAIKSCV